MKKGLLINTLFFMLFAGSFISCGKTHCPAFPEHLTGYIPYKQGDTLLFVNQHNDSLSLKVEKLTISGEHSISKCGKCDCNLPESTLEARGLNFDYLLFLIISVGDKYSKSYINFELIINYWEKDSLHFCAINLFFHEESGKDPFNPKNSDLFGEIVIIEDKEQQISYVTIVNGVGITEFYDQKYDFQWKSIK